MKTLQIKLAFAALFLITSVSVSAQSNKTSEDNQSVPLLKEIPASNNNKTVVTSSRPAPQRTNARVSEYFQMEKKIIAWSVAGEIPSSFPKHIEGQTKEQYIIIFKEWVKSHLDLVKEEYYVKLFNEKAKNKETK